MGMPSGSPLVGSCPSSSRRNCSGVTRPERPRRVGGLAGPVARLGLVPVVVLVEAFGHLLYVIVGPARAESGDREHGGAQAHQEPLGAATEGTDNGRGHAQPLGRFGRAVTDDTRQEHGRRRLGRDTAGPDGGADLPRQRIGGRATRPCGELAEAVEADVMGGGPALPPASVPGTRPTLGPPAQGRAAVAEPLRQRSRPPWRPPPPSTGSPDRPGEPPDRQGWHRTGASSKRLRPACDRGPAMTVSWASWSSWATQMRADPGPGPVAPGGAVPASGYDLGEGREVGEGRAARTPSGPGPGGPRGGYR